MLLLIAQFLMGMIVNCWVTIPSAHPGANADNYFLGVVQGNLWALGDGRWALRLHVVGSILLFLVAIALVVAAIAARSRLWITVSLIGWSGIWAAGFNGASFLNYGHDFSSLFMAIGFALALGAYAIGLYFARAE